MARRALLTALSGVLLMVPVTACGSGPQQVTPPAQASSPQIAHGTAARFSDPPLPAAATPAGTSDASTQSALPPGHPAITLAPMPAPSS